VVVAGAVVVAAMVVNSKKQSYFIVYNDYSVHCFELHAVKYDKIPKLKSVKRA
jgi:hypothetical protein